MRYVFLICAFLSTSVFADPLEEALTIVMANSESIKGKQKLLGITNKSSNWNTNVKLSSGYSDKQNDEFAPGFQNRAMLTFEYPLTGGTTSVDKEKAQTLNALYHYKKRINAML